MRRAARARYRFGHGTIRTSDMTGLDLSSARLAPAPGSEGWLARLPGAVVWVPGAGTKARELFATCLAAGGPMELLGRVGSRLADPQAAPWPPFAIIAARGAELVLVVHGPVEVEVAHGTAETKLYGGEDVGSWLNRALKGATALRSGKQGADDDLVDLRAGVIRASGFALMAELEATVAEGAGEGATSAGEALPSTQVEGRSASQSSQEPRGEPDAPTEVEVAAGAPGEGATLRGISCPNGHLNDPRDSSCRVCGARLEPGAPEVVGPRPPLGRLTWDNGEVYELSGATLVGREVAADAGVIAGELVAMVPGGQNDSMSRVHAELRPDGWDVVIVDRGSTNGTFVWDEKTKAWQRLVPGEPQRLRSGMVIAFGERTATFEAT
ncbi:MAG: FHA domain-containing protein [Acidimicrobiales bacterium]